MRTTKKPTTSRRETDREEAEFERQHETVQVEVSMPRYLVEWLQSYPYQGGRNIKPDINRTLTKLARRAKAAVDKRRDE